MARTKVFTDKQISRIIKLVYQNMNPNKIAEKLEYEFNKKFNYTTIRNNIMEICNKYWDSNKMKYLHIIDPDQCEMWIEEFLNWQDIKGHDFDYDILLENTFNNFHNDLNSKPVSVEEKPLESKNNNQIPDEISDKIINDLRTIYKNINQLHSKLNMINNKISSWQHEIKAIKENIPSHDIQSLISDLINIYAGKTSKKSVNINSVINEKVMKMIEKEFGIKNNNSLAINTALLISLYGSNIKDILESEK